MFKKLKNNLVKTLVITMTMVVMLTVFSTPAHADVPGARVTLGESAISTSIGDTVTFTMTIKNNGTDLFETVSIVEKYQIFNFVDFVEGSVKIDSITTTDYTYSSSELKVNLPDMNPGDEVIVSFEGVLKSEDDISRQLSFRANSGSLIIVGVSHTIIGSGIGEYTVFYNANDGSGSEYIVSETVGNAHIVLTNSDINLEYIRNGYTFLGWSENPNATTADYFGNENIGSTAVESTSIILYAVWKQNPTTYQVTYDNNGGIGNVPVDGNTYITDSQVTVLGQENLTKDGYLFNGWNSKADGSGTNYKENETFSITEDTTLYAQWIENKTINIENNNETTPNTGDLTNSTTYVALLTIVVVFIGFVLYKNLTLNKYGKSEKGRSKLS